MVITIQKIKDALSASGYCANDWIIYALYASMLADKPLLIEGAPGVGKTCLAKAVADGMGLPYIRMQMYEGLTADQILYDYDYQKQLLTLEAVRPKLNEAYQGLSLQESIKAAVGSMDFYGEDFLIRRPVLRAISSGERTVIVFDEIDKAPEELEYMLYEFLENYSITIPQYGEIRCRPECKPVVLLTSNSYRELSGALKRRCNYLYIEQKTQEEVIKILMARTGISESLAKGVAKCLQMIQNTRLHQMPSIAEAIDFADFLSRNGDVTKSLVMNSLGILCKNRKDETAIRQIVNENGSVLWQG